MGNTCIKDEESLTSLLNAIRQKIRIAEQIGMTAQLLASTAQDTANQAKSYGESALTGIVNEATNRKAEDAKLNATIGELSNTLTERINTIIGENASSAIDNFNEILHFLNGITDSSSLLALLNLLREDISSNTNLIKNLQEVHKSIFYNYKNGVDINTLEKGIYNLVARKIITSDPVYPSGEVATLHVVNVRKSEADSTIYKGGFLFGYCSINSYAKIVPSTTFSAFQFDGVNWSEIITSNSCLTLEDAGAGWYNILKDGVVILTVQSEAEFDRFEGALNSVIADINDRLSMYADDINTLENETNNVKEDFNRYTESQNTVVEEVNEQIKLHADDINVLTNELNNVKDELPNKANKSDGVLHILTNGAFSYKLNGITNNLESAGEHLIECPKGSILEMADYTSPTGTSALIGIFRFDGIINNGFMCAKIQFIKNTSIALTNQLCYEASKLTEMEGCRILVADGIESSYGLWRSSSISVAPYFDCKKVPSISNLYHYCKNLISAPYLDTSNITAFTNMFYGCDSLVSVPLYDTSKATSIAGMFTWCQNLRSLPKFDFSKVVNGTCAFTLCGSITEFPDYFNFGKLVTAPYIFAGDWGFYNEQKDTYAAGSLRRFPAYSFPEAVDMTGAWQDQSKLYSLGKINMPKCTNLTSAFKGCFNLTSVGGFTGLMCNIDMAHCSKLTVTSLVAIMTETETEAATVTALGLRTMTLGVANLAKLTDAQKAIATDKGWTLA